MKYSKNLKLYFVILIIACLQFLVFNPSYHIWGYTYIHNNVTITGGISLYNALKNVGYHVWYKSLLRIANILQYISVLLGVILVGTSFFKNKITIKIQIVLLYLSSTTLFALFVILAIIFDQIFTFKIFSYCFIAIVVVIFVIFTVKKIKEGKDN